jgi:hypothetical protein
MNDTTPRQIAAAKKIVNNGSALWIWSHMVRSFGGVLALD